MSGLPKGWVKVELGDTVLPLETCDPSKEGDVSFRYVDIGSINNRTFSIENPKSLLGREAPSRARRRIRRGDVLFSTVRTYLKNIAMVPEELDDEVTSTGVAVLRSSGAIIPKFLFSTVRSDYFIRELSLKQDGTLYPAITDRDLFGHQLSLPPLAEQKRIVAKLDALNAKSVRARTELARIETLVSRYKQAVLSKAFTGELVTSQKTGGRRIVTLGEVLDSISGGWSPVCEKYPATDPSRWGVITTTSIQAIKFDFRENKALPLVMKPRPHMEIRQGDVLITRKGPRVRCGICCFVENTRPNLMVCDTVYRLRLKDCFDGEFFAQLMSSPEMMRTIDEAKSGGNESGLNITHERLKSFMLPLWDKPTQTRCVQVINTTFAKIDRLAAQAKRALVLVGKLDEAILAKAFRGELVPQDDNDEPAEKLLERIRAERAAAPKAKRGRGRKA